MFWLYIQLILFWLCIVGVVVEVTAVVTAMGAPAAAVVVVTCATTVVVPRSAILIGYYGRAP